MSKEIKNKWRVIEFDGEFVNNNCGYHKVVRESGSCIDVWFSDIHEIKTPADALFIANLIVDRLNKKKI